MRWIAIQVAAVAAACTTAIPEIEEEQFACENDEVLASGMLPCPESHWCDGNECRPRLGCMEDGASRPGCDRIAQRRCDPVLNPLTSAVACSGGNPTITTSTVPLDASCNCPDQGRVGTPLFCARFAEGPSGEYPLFLVPAGEELPIGQFGITGEMPDWRRCVFACSSEADCPASHTCRPAPIVGAQLSASPSSRHTIGVCYPNLLAATSTTVVLPQPDPNVCLANEECPGDCRYDVQSVSDHPVLPIGSAWDGRKALIARCVARSSGLADPGRGCTQDADCKSGLCGETGRCQRPCNPSRETFCRNCLEIEEQRAISGSGEVVIDKVHVCETP